MTAIIRRLRTGPRQAAVAQLRLALEELTAELPDELVVRVETLIGRHERLQSGWSFVMVEPNLYSQIVDRLASGHSKRPLLAVRLWARLFSKLPPDSNDVQATRAELAHELGCAPRDISEVMGELEELGAVYRRKEGRGVRYFVHPKFGTHLTGAARERAQAAAPELRLVLSQT